VTRPAQDAGESPVYFSRYGGLWTDRGDALQRLDQKLEAQELSWHEFERVRFWMDHGYVILEQAVDPALCDRVSEQLEVARQSSDQRILAQHPDQTLFRLDPSIPMDHVRVLDIYVFQEAARDALLSPDIRRFLHTIFEEEALLLQSLSFHQGTEQGIHQDTAYVATSEQMRLAAAWIALEDVAAGSGELMYYDGSHRLPEYHFSDRYKGWKLDRDGQEQHTEWSALLHENARAAEMPLQRFLPRKGDVFIWSADLAHGGSPIEDRSLTRRSIVGHFIPVSTEPEYMTLHPGLRTRMPWNGFQYSSAVYNLGELEQELVGAATGPAPAPPARLRRLLSRMRGSRGG
jgi:phytanoyl-CoA hydroxylase